MPTRLSQPQRQSRPMRRAADRVAARRAGLMHDLSPSYNNSPMKFGQVVSVSGLVVPVK